MISQTQQTHTAKLYADAGTLYCTSKHQEQYTSSLNADLSLINDWGVKWKVMFAPKKGTVPEVELFLGGPKLRECDGLDILGVNYQRNLSFTTVT